jgi:hypothetical protein
MMELTARAAHQRGGGFEESEPPVPERRQRMTQGNLDRREQARSLYLLGERCRKGGDLRMAAGFYQESCQACPGCYYSALAYERLRHLRAAERLSDGAEEQDLRDTPGGTRARRWSALWNGMDFRFPLDW